MCIKVLFGKCLVYINGFVGYVENIMVCLGIVDLFDDIFDVVVFGFVFKFYCEGFDFFISCYVLFVLESIMFEDSVCNLKMVYDMGFMIVFVWVKEGLCDEESVVLDEYLDYVYYVVDCLRIFLGEIWMV